MKCRARPKYFTLDMINYVTCDTYDENEFYFNSGSKGTYFFLKIYSMYVKKQLNVGIQSFTCSSMLDAIVDSGNVPVVFDVKLVDCSLDFKCITNFKDLDILILTHYQGIPNHEYEVISEYCHKNNILLFEDLAHGSESLVNGVKIGSLANIYMESYGFDKPFTCCRGGKIVLHSMSNEFKRFFQENYLKLSAETEQEKLLDFKRLLTMYRYTDEKIYHHDLNNFIFRSYHFYLFFIPNLIELKLYRKMIVFLYKCLCKISQEKVCVKRLHKDKIGLIQQQQLSYRKKTVDNNVYRDYCNLFPDDEVYVFEKGNMSIVWNRYSIIDYTGKVKEYFQQNNIECGNYNWSICLHDLKDKYKNMILVSGYQNSDILKSYIVNFPCW